MRSLLIALCLLVVACTPPSASEQTPAPTSANPPSSAASVACARALTPLRPVSASFDLLPHHVGDQILFGLDGAFVASTSSYPLGAGPTWRLLDASGAAIRDVEIGPARYGHIQQSPDGAQFLFSANDGATGGLVTFVRDTAGGSPRVLAVGDIVVDAWTAANDVLFERRDDMGVFHVIDTRSLVDTVVFRPPAPPSVAAATDYESFSLSGDLRWAVFNRWHADDSLARIDLFDVRSQTYVPALLPLKPSWLVPRGDVLVWIDGNDLRAMHLCDRRAMTLAALPNIGTPMQGGLRFSTDGRYFSVTYGLTNEVTPPERDIVVDLEHSTIADIQGPWGFVRQWSSERDVVVLSRSGFHTSVDRLARFSMP